MLRKISQTGSQNYLTKKVINKAQNIYKNEKISYQSAFLAQSRQALLPYLQRGGEVAFPDEDEENEIMR